MELASTYSQVQKVQQHLSFNIKVILGILPLSSLLCLSLLLGMCLASYSLQTTSVQWSGGRGEWLDHFCDIEGNVNPLVLEGSGRGCASWFSRGGGIAREGKHSTYITHSRRSRPTGPLSCS
ncbi:hypothetical protein B0F90DRAFT_825482 [Multifurca ochricompacta]|uniref:Uncharacterized protein n=1 Tax=Multifurca ochricompacta TaxID=376703 RepID=A0AAD4M3B7_9AGAM|nr:hypothetical protein B0F90DRAFT_825482 [Multifurca ochricompacta]